MHQPRQGQLPRWLAPYNFVRLPGGVVQVEEPPDQDRYYPDAFTGAIEIKVTTETPFFIPGSGESKSDFFRAPDGVLKIVGSSFRGAIRSLFETITWSGTDSIDDSLLFYRRIPGGEWDDLGKRYTGELDEAKVFGGWISKDRSTHSVHRAKSVNERTWFKVEKRAVEVRFPDMKPRQGLDRRGNPKADLVNWKRREVWFHPPDQEPLDLVTTILPRPQGSSKPNENAVVGTLIRPGSLDKGEYDWIIPAEMEDEGIELDRDVVEEYQESSGGVTRLVDKNRFSVLPRDDRPLPAFFVERDGVIYFGHTRFFRLPYKNRIHSAIPVRDFAGGCIDMTRSVFGYTAEGESGGRRGRVFFGDLGLIGDPHPLNPAPPRGLFSPRPTSYQLYLEASDGSGRIVDWDQEARVRGTKMYWHRKDTAWQAADNPGGRTEAEKRDSIAPLGKGATFTGTIRFENLAEHELGGLLFALDLPLECRHHLGFGKPLGMGSVHVKIEKVRLFKRPERYQRIFDETGGAYYFPQDEGNVSDIKEKFAEWMVGRLAGIGDPCPGEQAMMQERLWAHPRMQELRKMLDFDHAPPALDTAYLDDPKKFERNRALPRILGERMAPAGAVAAQAAQGLIHGAGATDAPTIASALSRPQERERTRVREGVRQGKILEDRGAAIRVEVEGLDAPIDAVVGMMRSIYKPEELAVGCMVTIKVSLRGGKPVGQLLKPP